MEPGGSHGLQNRSRPDHVGLGGFDSHALPPASAHCLVRRPLYLEMLISEKCILSVCVVMSCAFPSIAVAQRVDTVRAGASVTAAQLDTLRTPIGPRRAFLYSFLVPGYSQSVLGRHKAATLFMLVEAISVAMI